MIKFLQKTSWVLMIILLALTPLHGLLSTFLLYKLELVNYAGVSLLIAAWKELLVGLLAVIAVVSCLVKRREMTGVQWFIIGFVAVGLIVSLINWQQVSLTQFIWGARTEWSFLVLLFALVFLMREWTKQQVATLVKVAIGTGVVVLIWGLLVQLVGAEFLVNLGYRNDWSTFYLDQAPAFCQKEGGVDFCRMQSTFVGPNRYAAYLLVMLPLFWFGIKRTWQKYLLVLLGVISLGLTLSSTAWMALGLMVVVYLAWFYRRLWLKYWKVIGGVGVVVVLVGGVLAIIFGNRVLDASGSEHFVRTLAAWHTFVENPLGFGVGTAGPASYKVGDGFIPENWYLQVAVNTGIFGLVMFMAIWVEVFRKIHADCKRKVSKWQLIAGLALIGVLAQNFFLHTWEEPGVYVVLLFLVGVGSKE